MRIGQIPMFTLHFSFCSFVLFTVHGLAVYSLALVVCGLLEALMKNMMFCLCNQHFLYIE